MILFLDFITFLWGSFISVISIKRLVKKKSSLMDICIILFWAVQILPLFIELVFRDLNSIQIESKRVFLAMTDDTVALVYDAFTLIIILGMGIFAQKMAIRQVSRINSIGIKQFQVNSLVYFVICIFIYIPIIIAVCLAPSKNVYFEFSYFYSHNILRSSVEYLYHVSTVYPATKISLLMILLSYYFNKKTGLKNCIHIILGIVIGTWVEGKRGFLIYALLGILVIDYIKGTFDNYKYLLKKAIWFGVLIISYFFLYSQLTGKGSNSSFFSEYTFYFSRLSSVKLALYDKLYENRMLEYNGQSILYNLLFFVPRSIWPEKPVMYCRYFTGYAYTGDGTQMLGGNLQVNLWAEFVSNFGILGIAIALLFTCFIVKKIEMRSKNVISYYSGIAFICLYYIFGFESIVTLVYSVWICSLMFSWFKIGLFKR